MGLLSIKSVVLSVCATNCYILYDDNCTFDDNDEIQITDSVIGCYFGFYAEVNVMFQAQYNTVITSRDVYTTVEDNPKTENTYEFDLNYINSFVCRQYTEVI